MNLKEKIRKLKEKRNAIILAHVYQRGEVQDIADYVGDSLDLSKKAVNVKNDVIVFCGVRFMAETASILNPDKIILLPDKYAGCSLADMAAVEDLKAKKKKYPNAIVVSYINSSATIKAESDVCCTSANAVKVVEKIPKEKVLFTPDKNLGAYVNSKVDKEVILWNGYCYVHENITKENISSLKKLHPDAKVIVHPECNMRVINLADYVGSTSQMTDYVKKSDAVEFIVGTENGLVHKLKKENPEKVFYPTGAICKDMEKINLEKIFHCLENMQYQIKVPEKIRYKAKKALERMLES